MVQLEKIRASYEQKWVREIIGFHSYTFHSVVEVQRQGVVVPRCGQAPDHDIEGVVIGSRDSRENEGSVGHVLEVDELREEEVGLVDGAREHLGVDLLDRPRGSTSSQDGQERLAVNLLRRMDWDWLGFQKAQLAGSKVG